MVLGVGIRFWVWELAVAANEYWVLRVDIGYGGQEWVLGVDIGYGGREWALGLGIGWECWGGERETHMKKKTVLFAVSSLQLLILITLEYINRSED